MPQVDPAPRAGGRVLLTGHRGMVGRVVAPLLVAAGFDIVGLDRAEGADLDDAATVERRVHGCRYVVHLAALDEPDAAGKALGPASTGSTAEIMRTNVGGTSTVLTYAAAAGVERVVLLSSVDVLGCFLGAGRPVYLPIDDDHPVDPHGAYAWSKLAAEELTRAFTDATGRASVCLRAPGVLDDARYRTIRAARRAHPESEWSPFWEYGAFLDVRDLASAVLAALLRPGLTGHHRLLVNADDISSAAETGPGLAARLMPDVPLRPSPRLERDPFAALVDSSRARSVLGWAPAHRWRPGPPIDGGRPSWDGGGR